MRDENAELWEADADWWQRQLTDGVDPEYTEESLPIVTGWTAGRRRNLVPGLSPHPRLISCARWVGSVR